MNYTEAIEKFKKKYPQLGINGYAKVRNGIVVGATSTPDYAPILECAYYLVKDNGDIVPTNPMLADLDFDRFKKYRG